MAAEPPQTVDDPTSPRPFAVVTGGSDGIGLAVAHRLATRSMAVLLVARRANRLACAAREIRGKVAGARVEILALDVTTPDAPEQIERALASAGGKLDLLVNAAGIGLAGPLVDQNPVEIDRLLQLNVVALTRLTRHFLPVLLRQRRGGLINFASLGGTVPGPNQAAYYASKAYVISLTEAVASEIAGSGVRVIAISPGRVRTQFHDRMGAHGALYQWLLPSMGPDTVAVWSLLAYDLGLRGLAPGIVNTFMFILLRVLPHRVVVPLVGWLLSPRGKKKETPYA